MQKQDFWSELSLSLDVRIKISYTKCSCFLGEFRICVYLYRYVKIHWMACMQKLCDMAAMHDLSG